MSWKSIGVGALLATAAGCGGEDRGDRGNGGSGGEPLPYCERSLADRKAAVCQAWTCGNEATGTVQPAWTGSVESCDPGDEPAIRAAAVAMANTYRFLAGLPPVEGDPRYDEQAQACALMMDANRALSHEPPESWSCFDRLGRSGAGNSNIASGHGLAAVHMYMADFGAHNADTLGHRRWLLSPLLERVGVGSTDDFSCMWVVHPFTEDEVPFVAWPPPGPVPTEVVHGVMPWGGNLDTIGWSIQSNRIDLSAPGITVAVTEDGAERPVALHPLGGLYGSRWALRIVPEGWETAEGRTYAVRVEGAAEPIEYEFELVSCSR